MSSARAERITREAISRRLAISSFLMRVIPAGLHPEDAEAAASLDGLRMSSRQADGQHGAGVARVDHAVVVEACRGEERMRLPLDLRLDVPAAFLVGAGAELAAGCIRGLPADDGQHPSQLLGAHH